MTRIKDVQCLDRYVDMKDKDLMIGNAVNYFSLEIMVTAIKPPYFVDLGTDGKTTVTNASIEFVSPIPITEEFLGKNGFVLDDDIEGITEEKFYLLKLDKFTITIHEGSNTMGRDWWIHIDNEDCCTIASADIQYVHHFQNLLNIMNIKFDIVL